MADDASAYIELNKLSTLIVVLVKDGPMGQFYKADLARWSRFRYPRAGTSYSAS